MSTSSPANHLFQLQENDTNVAQVGKAISQVEKQIADNSVLARARAVRERAEKQATELKTRQRELEMNDMDLTAKIKAVSDQLYGGKVGNPKELANLQHEADILKLKLNALEDSALEVMEWLEEAGAVLERARADLLQVETAEQQRKNELDVELKSQKERLATLISTRAGLVSQIESGLVTRYDRLRGSKGLAVAAVERGICQGCRIALFTAQMQQVRAGHLINCDNCGRFLHLA